MRVVVAGVVFVATPALDRARGPYSPAYKKGHAMLAGWRYKVDGCGAGYRPFQGEPMRYMLAHSEGVEYAKSIEALDFSVIDPFFVWSVHADYNRHQVCIGMVQPVSKSDADVVYAVGVDSHDCHYVNGTVFLPGVMRRRLVNLAGYGKFDVYNLGLPHVVAKPVISSDGLLALESKPA